MAIVKGVAKREICEPDLDKLTLLVELFEGLISLSREDRQDVLRLIEYRRRLKVELTAVVGEGRLYDQRTAVMLLLGEMERR